MIRPYIPSLTRSAQSSRLFLDLHHNTSHFKDQLPKSAAVARDNDAAATHATKPTITSAL